VQPLTNCLRLNYYKPKKQKIMKNLLLMSLTLLFSSVAYSQTQGNGTDKEKKQAPLVVEKKNDAVDSQTTKFEEGKIYSPEDYGFTKASEGVYVKYIKRENAASVFLKFEPKK
jgi:hypothetical protein